MKIINSYQELPICRLQQTRLYMQSRPLLQIWSKHRRGRISEISHYLPVIDSELNGNFIAIDCAGWYFANSDRHCKSIEINPLSSKFWNDVHYEYDYLDWHPNYLPNWPVLAFYSTYFKYSELDKLLNFLDIWSQHHSKLIVGLDPTKIKFNYLKYNLLSVIYKQLGNICCIRTLINDPFDLIITIERNENSYSF